MNRIRILATSNINGQIDSQNECSNTTEYMGLARLKPLVDSLRDEDTLLIDNGDSLYGSPLGLFHMTVHPEDINPVSLAMKDMQYDYINIGSHDFAFGRKALQRHLDTVGADCTANNILYRDEPYGATYAIREIGGYKIAIFSIVSVQSQLHIRKDMRRGFRFSDPIASAKRTIELLRTIEKPDYIICMYSSGLEKNPSSNMPIQCSTDENQGLRILNEVRGIDVLIAASEDGSCSTKYHDTLVIQVASSGKELACVDIHTDSRTIEPHILKADCEPDAEVFESWDSEYCEYQKWLDSPVGMTDSDLLNQNTYSAMPALAAVMNSFQQSLTQTDISSVSIPADAPGMHSEITMRDLACLYLMNDCVCIVELTGQLLRQYIEKTAEFLTVHDERITAVPSALNCNVRSFDWISGIQYTINVANDIGHRVSSLKKDGQDIQDSDTFTLSIPYARLSGSDGYRILRDAKLRGMTEASCFSNALTYIQKEKCIHASEDNNVLIEKI